MTMQELHSETLEMATRTIEQFFLERYEQLEKENAQLKEELNQYYSARTQKYGVFVSGEIKGVRARVVSSWNLDSGIFKEKDSAWIEAKKADIKNARDWQLQYGQKAIAWEEKTFVHVLEVILPDVKREYGVTASGNIEELYSEVKLDGWLPIEKGDELLELAESQLLENMNKRIEALKKKENE